MVELWVAWMDEQLESSLGDLWVWNLAVYLAAWSVHSEVVKWVWSSVVDWDYSWDRYLVQQWVGLMESSVVLKWGWSWAVD